MNLQLINGPLWEYVRIRRFCFKMRWGPHNYHLYLLRQFVCLIYLHAELALLQVEFMDSDLLAAGIDLTHDLDRRFGLAPKVTMSQVRAEYLIKKTRRMNWTVASAWLPGQSSSGRTAHISATL